MAQLHIGSYINERWTVWTLDTIAWIVWTLDMDMTRNWIVGTLHRWLEKAAISFGN